MFSRLKKSLVALTCNLHLIRNLYNIPFLFSKKMIFLRGHLSTPYAYTSYRYYLEITSQPLSPKLFMIAYQIFSYEPSIECGLDQDASFPKSMNITMQIICLLSHTNHMSSYF